MDELNWVSFGEATECSCGYAASHECKDVSYEVAQARAPQAGVPLRKPWQDRDLERCPYRSIWTGSQCVNSVVSYGFCSGPHVFEDCEKVS